MLHFMKVVQTEVSETEYSLLAAYAKLHGKTLKDAVREAIRNLTLRDEVDPEDPIFRAFPLTKKKPRWPDASEKVDVYLYGHEP